MFPATESLVIGDCLQMKSRTTKQKVKKELAENLSKGSNVKVTLALAAAAAAVLLTAGQ